ncbi:hypothetical protein BDZ45DRAFT_498473 [Acephala macrosclerotiorum]|nr:hypothetical protein BDZ45DRAFT_498473 [Acephala macrosclerotiorum]
MLGRVPALGIRIAEEGVCCGQKDPVKRGYGEAQQKAPKSGSDLGLIVIDKLCSSVTLPLPFHLAHQLSQKFYMCISSAVDTKVGRFCFCASNSPESLVRRRKEGKWTNFEKEKGRCCVRLALCNRPFIEVEYSGDILARCEEAGEEERLGKPLLP